ncbi:N-6 DNA methylase [Enterobacter hormaechei]|uniref:N-6 DNA methylase n=1 Tax=Enterobacter hormaechei TaxID=158836 RepID=UPI000750080D|nr:N-6 DNA methylase [Enterobacter hormaechei]MBT1879873.1 N-6 DNA methylase [Enterobacter hormaechei subsp. xiangfangensis]EKY3883892.1 N-6 DNA methylase [Enterobacter hormaechei]KUQ71284.1 hypothetical protein AWI24_11005 [Enterobacter hormaechei subsp. steigerwaltii]MCO6021207.1 N-6 DNA methylase [Enterobacter hormaechei]HDC4655989.1 N-6 DNA methylase [Enterobacter hormaechei]
MVEFKQFYTQQGVSELLISLLEHEEPITCLELSAGEGALLDSASTKFPHMEITAFDIDPKNAALLSAKYPKADIYCMDSTDQKIHSILHSSRFDIALCNPPFQTINNTKQFESIVEDVFGTSISTKKIRSEVIFLAINLLYLKDGGELAIILPDLFFSSASYNWLRRALINNFTIKNIIECEHRSFLKTEAKTYIFHISKSISEISKISYFKYKNVGDIQKDYISVDSLEKKEPKLSEPNNDYYSVFRGRLSGKECKKSGCSYFHTNSFKEITYTTTAEESIEEHFIAKNGDVLIARVGSRIVGEYEIFKGNKAVVSDCIFCLSFYNEDFKIFFLDFWMKNKHEWLESHISGTCAKHISLLSIRNLLEELLKDFKKVAPL